MKKLFIFLSVLFIHTFSLGQEVRELSKEYFLDLNDLEHFDKGNDLLNVKERVNYALFLKVEEDYNRLKHPSEEDKIKAYETKPFIGEKGEYSLHNEFQKFHFNLDENGFLSGSANLVQTNRGYTYYWNFDFDAGKLKYAELKTDPADNPFRKIHITGSTFEMQFFEVSTGKLRGKKILNNYKDYDNSTEIIYDENEVIVSEENKLLQTKKTFYKNGEPKYFHNSLTDESIDYDDKGRITQHLYTTKENEKCYEDHENGLIINKKCRNADATQMSQYYYKNGNLVNYQITDNKKEETRTYDKNNKLIHTAKNAYKTGE